MSDLYLFDHDINFYRHGCRDESGNFDPEKAAALGFAESQFPAIIEVLGVEPTPAAPSSTEEVDGEE